MPARRGRSSRTIERDVRRNSPRRDEDNRRKKDFNISFVKQIGDIGLIVRWILFAVFFTLLLVVGNTMAQSVREAHNPSLQCSRPSASPMAACSASCSPRRFTAVPVRRPGRAAAGLRWPAAMVEKGTGGQFQLQLDGSVWLARGRGHRAHGAPRSGLLPGAAGRGRLQESSMRLGGPVSGGQSLRRS